MKRWMLWVGAAVVGVVLAWLLMPSTNTGEVERPTVQNTADDGGVARNTSQDDWRPQVVDAGVQGAPGGRPTPGGSPVGPATDADGDGQPDERPGNPAYEEFAKRLETPESKTAAGVYSKWVQVRRLMREHENDDAVKPLIDETSALLRDLTRARRSPDAEVWKELEGRQRNLLGTLEQTGAWDAEMQKAAASVEGVLASYEPE